MRRGLLAPLVLVLVVGSIPLAGAQDDGEARCIEPPDVKPTYEWFYELPNDRMRHFELRENRLAGTPRGPQNVTQMGFEDHNSEGQPQAWGTEVRYAPDSIFPWGLTTRDHWERTDDGQARRMDAYDPPLMTIHAGSETCPGDAWDYTTTHRIVYGEKGEEVQEAEEDWRVRAFPWTNVTVPAGTFEVMPTVAVREVDSYRITTYWSPEAMAPAKVEAGPGQTTQSTEELSRYILDQRPKPLFKITPVHPEVGDTVTLDATGSFDPDGNITHYRWEVGEETYEGPVVEFTVEEEKLLNVRLVITDDGDRKASLSGSRYVSPPEGQGLGIHGPTQAYRGEIVTLQARPSFDPVDIRWRENSTVVAQGPTYSFYMDETRNLSVDAFHETGRVYTTNHTVELVNTSEGGADRTDAERGYPPGADAGLAILEPLEGQVVSTHAEIHVRAESGATLTVDSRPVWQGTATPSQQVSVELEPGAHTLVLESGSSNHTVNVTAAEGGSLSASDPAGEASSSGDTSDTPAPSPLLLLTLAVVVAHLRRKQ